MPKVSILLTSYNHARFLREAIDSALTQSFGDFELLVLDDASTDGSWDIIQSYGDPRVRAIRNAQRESSGNLNRLLAGATGQYVAIHHSDDAWAPGKLQLQVEALDRDERLGAVLSRVTFIDERGLEVSGAHALSHLFNVPNRGRHQWLRHFFYEGNALCHPSALIRREIYQRAGGYRTYTQLPDFDFWIRLCLTHELHILDEPLLKFRLIDHAGNMSAINPENLNRDSIERFQILRNYLKLDGEDVFRIFPELRSAYPECQHPVVPFLVAAAAAQAKGKPWLRLFALDVIYGLMQDPEIEARLKSDYGFTRATLRAWAAEGGIFGAPARVGLALPGQRENAETATTPDWSIVRQGRATGARSAAVLHLHYADLWPEFEARLKSLPGGIDLYVSLTANARSATQSIAAAFPDACIAHVANRGRDIAPRLRMLQEVRRHAYDQVLMVHGKKSPHLREVSNFGAELAFLQHRDGDRWRRDLLDALFGSATEVIAAFAANPARGLIGPTGFWVHLQADANSERVRVLGQRIGVLPDPRRHGYFAGSMFWMRPQALDPLLKLNLQAADFDAEHGQTDATLAHALERVMAMCVEAAGLDVADTAGRRYAQVALPWLPDARWLPAERAWARQEFPDETDSQALAVIAVMENAGINADRTMRSISEQWLRPSLVTIAPGAPLTDVNAALLACRADWLGLIDGGDRLAPDAIFRLMHAARVHPTWKILYSDEDSLTPSGQHVNPHCKPDFNLDYLRSLPYVGGLMLIHRELFEALGGFDPDCEGAEDYDFLLRAWEHLQRSGEGEGAIGHVPEVLYHRAQGSGHSRKSVPELLAAGQHALQAHFDRLGIPAEVQGGPFPPAYRVRWPLPPDRPLVSILIPTRDQLGMLQRCVESVIEKTRYPAYEILIIDNDSQSDDAVRYLGAIESREQELGGRLRIIRAPGPFNFSAMNNLAARAARGDYLLLLNNDTAALHEEWLDEMMGHAVRPDVGVVGAKLLYPDGKIQHAGVILGMRGPAEHPFIGRAGEDRGYFGRAQLVQDLSAVTGACLLVRKSLYEGVGGLDENAFKVSYNDIDLCLKVRAAGLRVVFTPHALLLHEGSASQKGQVEHKPDEAKQKRFASEREAMYDKWLPLLARDPAYNRHLSLATTEFQIDDQAPLAWDPEWRPRPRILVHPADREGCGEYRIISPMRALNRAGMTQGWETMRLFQPAEMQRIDADSLVVQRQMEWPQIEALERNARLLRAFRVFEIDDLITNLPVKSVHRAHIHKDIAKRFRKAAGLCHRLVVATEPLAKAYAGFSDEVVVCPNYVERARWGELRPARAERKRPRVGWAGGVGHSGDLELIVDVVRQTAQQVDWVFFGLCPPELKDVVREFHPGVPLDQYAPKLAALDLDLAVAPLEHNAFNEAKSHLRLLEYGVLGYPVICSDITPYQGDFPVVRVANRFRDWVRAIQDAVSDQQALRAQGDALRAKVYEQWILEDNLDTWMRAWTR